MLDNQLYVCGGYDGNSSLSSVERYDPTNNKWTMASHMVRHRSAAAVAVLDGLIYVLGGHDGLSIFDSVRFSVCGIHRIRKFDTLLHFLPGHLFTLLCRVDVCDKLPQHGIAYPSFPRQSLLRQVLTIHICLGLSFLLLPFTSILITLLPTYSSSLLKICPYHFNVLSGTLDFLPLLLFL